MSEIYRLMNVKGLLVNKVIPKVGGVGQLFFAYRIWMISNEKGPPIVICIVSQVFDIRNILLITYFKSYPSHLFAPQWFLRDFSSTPKDSHFY